MTLKLPSKTSSIFSKTNMSKFQRLFRREYSSLKLEADLAVIFLPNSPCKVNIQHIGFALPLQLVGALGFIIMTFLCANHSLDPCTYNANFPSYLFFKYPSDKDDIWSWLWGNGGGWFWLIWFFSQIWITIHTWFPKSQRLARTEEMFGTPFYNSLLIEQSILLNRRSDNGKIDFWKANLVGTDQPDSTSAESSTGYRTKMSIRERQRELIRSGSTSKADLRYVNNDVDEITRIKGCATMWHESEEEMTEMLKSLFRIDEIILQGNK